jgi:hypothetical protein
MRLSINNAERWKTIKAMSSTVRQAVRLPMAFSSMPETAVGTLQIQHTESETSLSLLGNSGRPVLIKEMHRRYAYHNTGGATNRCY